MPPLCTDLRRLLEKKVVEARDAAEDAARGALKALAVEQPEPFPSMSEEKRAHRRELRACARQLGSFSGELDTSEGFSLLVSEVAYEQWHRMLFARFLAENDLLVHPELGVPVTLEDCRDLAGKYGESDEWMLAARFASEMLPGVFRSDDPTLRIRFAPEGRQALERILADLPPEVFTADDSLGWVYQFWQSKRKKEVNASERKIGGADIAPVTQLFTEHYMVAFLLENSLGAWWAGRHPESPLLKEWEYLRFAEDGTPAAGTFEGWPATAAEVTVMDPCCGSGHFLVAAFDMLRRMRQEEEGLSPRDAADAVLRESLFGLELDGRCVQIAVFALALAAWKVGGYRTLPPMNVACSGIPARGKVEDWRRLASGDSRLADALERLYHLFKDADTLGSLIDPRRAAESDTLFGVQYEDVAPLLNEALARYGGDDPAQQVFAQAAEDVATAAKLLAGRYTLVATNPPFLGTGLQTELLRDYLATQYPRSKADLATAFQEHIAELCISGGCVCAVSPHSLLYLPSFRRLRERLLHDLEWALVARLGPGAFEAISGEVVNVALLVLRASRPGPGAILRGVDVTDRVGFGPKAMGLHQAPLLQLRQSDQAAAPDAVVTLREPSNLPLLGEYADCWQGLVTADDNRYVFKFWELADSTGFWEPVQLAPQLTREIDGRHSVVRWERGTGDLHKNSGAHNFPSGRMLGRMGVVIQRMSGLNACIFTGIIFGDSAAPIVPKDAKHTAAVWVYSCDDSFRHAVRELNHKTNVTPATFLKIPFDLEHWAKVAQEKYPNGLPEPHSDDPTQWLFKGDVVGSESPLHVAVARLLGYRWPDQEPDELDRYCDTDGIVCLPAVAGDRPAADRLQELLAAAYGDTWSPGVLKGLLDPEGASDLENWLRDRFFASHCKLFSNRPFIWQVWDGRKDGFSALVNYHKLDRKLLERLIYTTLQSWIDRQKSDAQRGVGGAEARQAAAEELKHKLELILEGEKPYDIYVRWKPLSKQPIGWEPDINDGVRLNVRPFVEARVLRAKFNVKWEKDRGKNPDGSERLNDLHYTVAEKRAARQEGSSG